ncbi:HD domain-containing protein [Mucilaginibacter paludis]|uniref:Phosphonate degradation operons associated HDIG domain protein n=1 Tax=Mucilaginibacter paludis DSM 18603 TaxID=714943 RepID=H1Y8A0_9SPHI|nr:HD domain-containing protein [Mucilaginibacter paludis]EHQ24919.1 phosphonate degradation operons associated HDIG domain protein [Mucilaginibacter paludis DSM 18603]
MTFNPVAIVDSLFALYELHGNDDYIGEPVSQLEHMSQAAALAEAEGFEDEVILAAFFHDIGHLCAADGETLSMDGFGNVDHEKIGGDYLRKQGFSERMAALVESHVVAKRYLTYKFPEYYQQLSEASKATLQFQGGVMTAEEAREFELNPDAELIIKIRTWDDMAKETSIPVNNIDILKQKAISHLVKNQS